MSYKSFLSSIKILFAVMSFSLVTGCFDKPNEFVSPSWDVEFNIPITSKSFELAELVEKDSSLLKSFQDPNNLGLIYFGDTQSVATITVDDELKMDQFQTRFSQSIGPLKVSVPLPAATEIKVEDWTTDVTTGTVQVFPEQEGHVVVDVIGIQTVESILADEATLRVIVGNNLPVPIVLRGIQLRNKSDQSVVANKDEWVQVAAYDSITIPFDIRNKEITNTLEYVGTIWSGGSVPDSVIVPPGAGTVVLALFENLVIGAATAQLPVQTLQFNDAVIIDDSTKIENAVIDQGRITLEVNNNIDLKLNANIHFDNLFDANNNPYSLVIPLNRNEQNKMIEIPSLADWQISTSTPGVPTNQLTYSIDVTTDSTGEVSTITKNDSISFVLNFDELVFRSFSGQLKPTSIVLDESGFKLDYGDIQDNLKFGEINFKDAKFNLNLNSSMDFNLNVNGLLNSTNGTQTNHLVLDNIVLPSAVPVSIEISNLINGFSSELPDSFSMSGSALLNPSYGIVGVTRGDSVYGSIDFEIPLNVGISQGSFKDTFDVDLGEINEDDINKFNYGEVTFTITNSVPVGLTLTAEVLDANKNIVVTIPASYNNIDYVEIPKPQVTTEGNIISPATTEQTLRLEGNDIQEFLRNPSMVIDVQFGTAGDGKTPVKFMTSNKISFSVKGKASYKAEL